MSKKTPTTKTPTSQATTTKRTSKTPKPAPAKDASAIDMARAEALAKLKTNVNTVSNTKPNTPVRGPAMVERGEADGKRGKPARSTTRSAPERTSRASTADGSKRLSALAAAANVLQDLPAKEARAGLTALELIERMAAAGLWTSPGGKTPAATLYSAITREIAAKGSASRFAKADTSADGSRGRFVAMAHTARRARA